LATPASQLPTASRQSRPPQASSQPRRRRIIKTVPTTS
jgi:hypothetical protein